MQRREAAAREGKPQRLRNRRDVVDRRAGIRIVKRKHGAGAEHEHREDDGRRNDDAAADIACGRMRLARENRDVLQARRREQNLADQRERLPDPCAADANVNGAKCTG